MRNKIYHHGNLKKKLIEEGIVLISRERRKGLSLRRISTNCGVSHSAAYRHFKNKGELLQAIEAYLEERLFDTLLEVKSKCTEKEDVMAEIGQAYVLFFLENSEYFHFFVAQDHLKILISREEGIKSNFKPFDLFRETAFEEFKKWGVPKSCYIENIVSMWAIVHGLAGIATMKGVEYEGDWTTLVRNTLQHRHGEEQKNDNTHT